MNHFNHQRSNWIIGILVVLNLGTLLAIWLTRAPEPARPDMPHRVDRFLEKALELTPEQAAQFEDLRSGHHQTMRQYFDTQRDNRQLMLKKLTASPPDTAAAHRIAALIGEQQTALEELMIGHYSQLRQVCTPAQQEKLGEVFMEALRRKGPGGGPRGGPPGRRGRRR